MITAILWHVVLETQTTILKTWTTRLETQTSLLETWNSKFLSFEDRGLSWVIWVLSDCQLNFDWYSKWPQAETVEARVAFCVNVFYLSHKVTLFLQPNIILNCYLKIFIGNVMLWKMSSSSVRYEVCSVGSGRIFQWPPNFQTWLWLLMGAVTYKIVLIQVESKWSSQSDSLNSVSQWWW